MYWRCQHLGLHATHPMFLFQFVREMCNQYKKLQDLIYYKTRFRFPN